MTDAKIELEALLHPASAFGHPSQVVDDPDLTVAEKRAILASWASDACAIEAVPELRALPNGSPVSFDDVMDALRALDDRAEDLAKRYRRRVRRRNLFGRGFGDAGGSLGSATL
jgi:hypothetical protein